MCGIGMRRCECVGRVQVEVVVCCWITVWDEWVSAGWVWEGVGVYSRFSLPPTVEIRFKSPKRLGRRKLKGLE